MLKVRNTNEISFMIFAKSSGKSITFNITETRLKTLFISFLLAIVLLIIGIYLSYNTNLKEAAYRQLKKENKAQEKQLIDISNQMMIVQDQMTKLIEREEELEVLLGDQRPKRYSKKKNKKLAQFNKDIKKFQTENPSNPENIAKKIEFHITYLKSMNETYEVFVEKLHQIKTRFAATPSEKPLYGRLMSKYGWRRHPVTGKRKAHNGIDIASWTGAPIQATADGVVEYAGWSTSFGYVVVLDHGYGMRTYYAHCSQLLVDKRDVVQKGQIIAQVGSTGLSTGPHLHYEIRKRRKAVNPKTYLDLDMFTARDKVW